MLGQHWSVSRPFAWKGQERYAGHVSYLIRLRVLGVTDAVGEEERESCGEVVPIAMREAGDAPSDAEMSRFISSLLRRDTEKVIMSISSPATETSRQTTARTSRQTTARSTQHRATCLSLWTAALVTLAELWNPPRCQTTKQLWCIYTADFFSQPKKQDFTTYRERDAVRWSHNIYIIYTN